MTVIVEAGASAAPSATVVRPAYIEWGPVIAGAAGAAAISFVLLTFGSAIGLTAVSPWPNTGLSVTTVMILVALWAAIVQVGSFAAGGYIAGRLRSSWARGATGEHQFRDGAHGFVVWALAVLVGAWVVSTTAADAIKTGVQASAVATVAGTRAGETALQPTDYAIDYLFRPPTTRPEGAGPAATAVTSNEARAELTRILVASLRNGTMATRERAYLAQMVAVRTGMPVPEAERRVDEAFAEAKAAETKVREAADKARKAGALAAFLAAATLAASCAAACAGAAMGGRHKDEETAVRWFGASRFW